MIEKKLLDKIFNAIDKKNKKDPNKKNCGIPEGVFYSQKMTEILDQFQVNPSQELQIACRGQHIQRWKFPRSDYPKGRNGYLKWRRQLYQIHSELVKDILNNFQIEDQNFINRVGQIIAKKKIKFNPDSQSLEDVACLVFLKYYFDDFMIKHNNQETLIKIIQKTWNKMSKQAHKFTFNQTYSTPANKIIQQALKNN